MRVARLLAAPEGGGPLSVPDIVTTGAGGAGFSTCVHILWRTTTVLDEPNGN